MYHDVAQFFDLGGRWRETEGSSLRDGEPSDVDGVRRIVGGEDGEDAARREHVPHARLSVALEREMKRLAETLRVPMTNLVRALLEDAVAALDFAGANVEAWLKAFASMLEQERDKFRRRVMRDPLDGVFAFQPIKVAQTAICAKCKTELRRGANANLGLCDEARPSASRVLVCDACVPTD